MPTPERKSGQTAWARRQQQQQYNNSPGPFSRARPVSLNIDASFSPSPPHEFPARHRRKFSHTGTLGGAFEWASRLPSDNEEDLFNPKLTRRPSPRTRRTSSAMSLHSDPPELEEVYRQIDDANSLADFGPSDDENAVFRSNSDGINRRRLPTTSSRKDHRLSIASDVGFRSESPRRRALDSTKDEERLKRATSSRSPVLDRSILGTGPSSDHLRRREWENQSVTEEDKIDIEPSVNVPSTWGSKARHSQAWMNSLKRNRTGSTIDSGETPSRLPDKPSVKISERRAAPNETVRARPASSRYERPSPPRALTSPNQTAELPSGGQQIPNTPIVVFPSSTFTKRSPSKRDSQDLLRKLARTGSPNQTPEPTTSGRRIYDKTPIAPGGWIDTPMTQRAPTAQPMEITLQPSPTKIWGQRKLVEVTSHEDDKKVDTEELLSSFEPLKGKWEKTVEEPSNEKTSKDTLPTKKSAKEEEVSENKSESETKHPTEDNGSKFQTSERDQKPAIPLPDHPKSALETVLEDHKSNKESLDVGDDTIESLQAILDQQPSDDPKAEEEEDAAYEQQVIGQLESAQPAPSSDMKDFDRIEGKLQSLADTMAHLKTGLNQLGNRVSRDTEYIIASLSNSPKPTDTKPPQMRSCECTQKCSTGQTSISLPLLWKQSNVWWKPRPTWLGWCVVIPLVWYFSESSMCDYYCHPFASPNCEGNCLDPDAPRFPFVIPTMVSRWLHLSDILIPIWTLLVVISRFFTQLLGFSDGYVDDEPRTLNLSGKLWIGGTPVEGAATMTTSTSGGFIPPLSQWTWKQETHVPESVPEVDLEATPDDPWADVSMDEDEFL
ncbi:hypothetical protein BJX63DRAFT_183360 [Aspergillus granulosus]|uniref:Uncharacterized protein n=1 Tax=Aspergillus granulosus TaxID=176169 RepID=A0ABR4HHG7_9EURO